MESPEPTASIEVKKELLDQKLEEMGVAVAEDAEASVDAAGKSEDEEEEEEGAGKMDIDGKHDTPVSKEYLVTSLKR